MAKKKIEIPEELQNPVQVEDFLDLHGFFPEQVADVVQEFIAYAVEKKYTSVTIAHGKGKSRLKWEVHQTLKKNLAVLKYYDAAPGQGGWGRTEVELQIQC
ncbi:MAG: DNA mismatch repair protein MutS [Calditrichaeota bacterium]|nr:MAG: DNA mismatch repair protein MutS [Calditrichota bacterium]